MTTALSGTLVRSTRAPPSRRRDSSAWIRERTDKAFGINLAMASRRKSCLRYIELCLEYEAPVILTSYGNPTDFAKRATAAGRLVFHDVISLAHGKKAVAAGVDGIIAVAAGAGGLPVRSHRIARSRLKKESYSPILAAGCISDGPTSRGQPQPRRRPVHRQRASSPRPSAALPAYKRKDIVDAARRTSSTPTRSAAFTRTSKRPFRKTPPPIAPQRPEALEGHLERRAGRWPGRRDQADGRDRRRLGARGARHARRVWVIAFHFGYRALRRETADRPAAGPSC